MLYELHKNYLVVGMVSMPTGVILGITSPQPGTVVEASLVSELIYRLLTMICCPEGGIDWHAQIPSSVFKVYYRPIDKSKKWRGGPLMEMCKHSAAFSGSPTNNMWFVVSEVIRFINTAGIWSHPLVIFQNINQQLSWEQPVRVPALSSWPEEERSSIDGMHRLLSKVVPSREEFVCLRMILESNDQHIWTKVSNMLSRDDARYLIGKTNSLWKNALLLVYFSLFAFSSDVVLIRYHMHSYQQHSLINKIRNYRDEVRKCVVFFPASNLKVLLTLKDIRY